MPQGEGSLKFQDLPGVIQDFIADPNDEYAGRITDAAGLEGEARKMFFAEAMRVYLKELPVTKFFDSLKQKIKISEDKLKIAARDFIGYLFLPIDDFLGGQCVTALQALGGQTSQYPLKRIVMRQLTPAEVVGEVIHEHPPMVPAHLEARVREILESFVRGVRKEEEAVQRLSRAEKIGGAGMEIDEAHTIISAAEEKMKEVLVITSPIFKEEQPVAAPEPAAQTTVAESAPPKKEKIETVTPEDERLVSVIKRRVIPTVVPSQMEEQDKQVRIGVAAVLGALAFAVPSADIERLRAIIVSRLKDVRKAAEVKDLLVRPLAQGGLGLSAERAQSVSAAIEAQRQAMVSAHAAVSEKEKEQYVKEEVETTERREQARRAKDQEELNRLWSAVTKNPLPSSSVEPRATSAPQPPALPAPLYAPRPEEARPKVQDVRVAPKLVDLVEELRNLTLTDFRRLSANPKEALARMADKLVLLEDQSYTRRVEGIKAWQESEVNRLYLDILHDSLSSGKPILQVSREREAAGKLTLTERELSAIMEFNSSLKF